MLSEYAEKLRAHHCRFMLAEVGTTAHATLDHTGKLGELGEENVFAATDRVDQSVLEAVAVVESRLADNR